MFDETKYFRACCVVVQSARVYYYLLYSYRFVTDKLYRVDQFHRQFGEAVYSINQIDIISVVSQ